MLRFRSVHLHIIVLFLLLFFGTATAFFCIITFIITPRLIRLGLLPCHPCVVLVLCLEGRQAALLVGLLGMSCQQATTTVQSFTRWL